MSCWLGSRCHDRRRRDLHGMVRGVTRREPAHETLFLEYEAYKPCEAKMQQVADEIRERWPVVEGIAIVQRVGRLDPQTRRC